MATEQDYGQHNFDKLRTEEDDSGMPTKICECGATLTLNWYWSAIFPSVDPLPDPTQCRLNPLPNTKS